MGLVGPPAAEREALALVSSDLKFPAPAARAFRRALVSKDWEEEPEDWFGPFDELKPEAQRALRSAIEQDEYWRLRGYELGDWQVRLTRLLKGPGLRRLSRTTLLRRQRGCPSRTRTTPSIRLSSGIEISGRHVGAAVGRGGTGHHRDGPASIRSLLCAWALAAGWVSRLLAR